MTDSLQDVVADLRAAVEHLRSVGSAGSYVRADAYEQLADRLSALAAPVVSDEEPSNLAQADNQLTERIGAMLWRHFSDGMALEWDDEYDQDKFLDAAIDVLNIVQVALSPGRSGEVDRG